MIFKMNLDSKKIAILALIISSVIWGSTSTVMKLTLKEVPIFSLAFIRFFLAALLLYPFVRKKLSIDRKDIPILVISAFLGVTLNISFFFWGLTQTSALNAGIIVTSSPIFLILIAHTFLKEKISKNLVVGAVMSMVGISIIISKDTLANGLNVFPFGDFLILAATLFFVFYEVISKGLFKKYNPLVVTFYSFAIGAMGFLPSLVVEFQREPYWIQNISTPAIFGIIYGILFSSLIAYSFWEWGLFKISASKAGFFFYLDPIASTITAVVILSEKVTTPFLIGAAFIFIGLFFAESHPYRMLSKAFRKNSSE
ncbi:hypothetical protein C4559_03590 [Candidatus Microgenomates bacterium]|nr:MAG: hypothetical protein C4559_03590 [Candidatus Microgenomates bacterium]